MAIVSLVALLGALGVVALLSLSPWQADTVDPQVSLAPGFGIGLDDSVAVASGRSLAVAAAQPVVAGKTQFAAEEVGGEGVSGSGPAIGAARVAAGLQPAPSPGNGSAPPPEPRPAPETPPAPPAVVPVAVTPPSPPTVIAPPTRIPGGPGSPSGPIGAGTGAVEGDPESTVEIQMGDENAFGFSFLVQPPAYRAPGEENLIMRFSDAASVEPSFGLQVWDDGSGQRGLWASGEAMGGERFLAPIADGIWHEAVVDFKASSEGDGFYLLLLDGEPIDARAWVSLIEPGSSSAQIETGLFRDGERVAGRSDVLLGPTELGESLESVIP